MEIELKKPLIVDGTPRRVLRYDADALTGNDYFRAENIKTQIAADDKSIPFSLSVESDNQLHCILGWLAVLKVETDLQFDDFRRLALTDMYKLMKIGKITFFDAGDISPPASTGEP